jgi:hypothetical protein
MEDITEKFKEIEQKSPSLQLKLTGKITNLHGFGARRLQDIKRVVYSQVDTASTGEDKTAKASMAERTKTVEVKTFAKNGNGKIVAPFGGRYGYILGALKAATAKYGSERAKRSSPVYGLKTKLQQGVFVEPDFIELGDTFSNPEAEPAEFFLTTVGVSEYFDYVKEAPVEFTVRVEADIPENVILELLAFIQRLGMGPKRRGLFKIEKVEKVN